MLYAVIGIVALLVGIFAGYIIRKNSAERTIGSAETQAKNLILDAENRSEQIRKEALADARKEAHEIRAEAEKDIRERRDEVKKTENRLVQKEASLLPSASSSTCAEGPAASCSRFSRSN